LNLSVIIPYFNGSQYIQRCINSLGSLPAEQIIIVDNSDDNITFEINAKIITTKEKKLGFAKAVNIGLQEAYQFSNHTHVLILNQDAHFKLGHFDQMVEQLGINTSSKCKALDYFASPMIYTNEFTSPMPFIQSRYFGNGIPKQETAIEDFVAVALFASVKLMKELKGFDESYFMYYEDNDLFARCKISKPIVIYPQFHVGHYNPELATGQMSAEKKKWIQKSKILFLWNHGSKWHWLIEKIKSIVKEIIYYPN